MRSRLRLESYTLSLIVHTLLNLCDIDRVFFELCENNRESILDPKCFSFHSDSLLEVLIVLDRMSELPTRIHTLPFYRVDEVVWTFIAESHSVRVLEYWNVRVLDENGRIFSKIQTFKHSIKWWSLRESNP